MLTYPDPPFFVSPTPHMNVEATDKCCISCIVQCQGWAQSSKNPTIESIPAPQAPGVRSPGQGAQNTTNNPSPLDRALSGADREEIWRQGIFVFLTFLYPYLPLVECLNYYTWFNFENEGRINDSWIEAGKLGRFINSPSAFCPLYWINIDQKSWCWWVVGVRSVSFHEINNGSVSKRHRPPPPLHPISIHIHHKFCPIYKRMLLQKTIHWDSKLSSKEGTC